MGRPETRSRPDHCLAGLWPAADPAQDGTARYALEIVADEIQFLSPKPAAMGAAA